MANFFESKTGKKIMSMAYGLGAAVVIVGALFKIMHWPGANEMLIIGMGTEAVIFCISAFEPIHQEVDWTLVYPELAGMEPNEKKSKENKGTVSQQLDKMLEEAKVGPELISSLGTGLKSLSENVKGMSDISNAAVATNDYTDNVQKASKSLEGVSASYNKAMDAMNSLAEISTGTKEYQAQVEHISSEMKKLASNIASLNSVYGNMLSAMGGNRA
ncbi:MAG: gliding motility protein GldL [Bacteroidota bacterium]|nr:gliding motility protein GldL [Bacteroidota bacterium]MDX5430969.1 gliding motility protein GldL [Bacteroidota bacterium]MDX5469720.1 gliding motility protein GldL [Bacteroidota bacterium]